MQDKQQSTKVTLYLPQELHRQLKIRSAVDGEAMSAIAERALDFYLSHSEVVEEYSMAHGETHRVYSCPGCSESMVMREGELVPVSQVVASSESSEHLQVGMQDVVSGTNQSEEDKLVPC